jgi:HEAT repeat protein
MLRKSTSKSSPKKFSAIPAAPKAVAPVAKETKPVEIAAANEAVSKALFALRNADADIARDAAISLGKLGNAAAVEPLIEALTNANGYFHSVVRAAAAGSLAQLRDPRAVESLVSAIRDPLAEPSAEAIRALATIGDARAIAPLIAVVKNADGFFLPIARRAAVVALAGFKNPQATAEVLAVSQNASEDSVIRDAAKEAIAQAAVKAAAK